MTDSGVLMACARLPTWVRARSTISAVGVEQRVGLAGQRRDFDRKRASSARAAGAGCRRLTPKSLQRRQTEANLEKSWSTPATIPSARKVAAK